MPLCPLCREESSELHVEVEQLVIDLIARDHPEWKRADGSCPECIEYYEKLGASGADWELEASRES